MKQIAKQLETTALGTRRMTNRAGFSRGAFAVLGVLALFAATTSARAACGDPGRSAEHVTLPSQSQSASASDSIVGLWHVIYSLSRTVVFNESFDTWHSDGTEYDKCVPASVGEQRLRRCVEADRSADGSPPSPWLDVFPGRYDPYGNLRVRRNQHACTER
jgi:hypothetical protein